MAEDDISELLSPWDRLTTLDTENPAKSPPYLPSVVVAGGEGVVTNMTQLLVTSYYQIFLDFCFSSSV